MRDTSVSPSALRRLRSGASLMISPVISALRLAVLTLSVTRAGSCLAVHSVARSRSATSSYWPSTSSTPCRRETPCLSVIFNSMKPSPLAKLAMNSR